QARRESGAERQGRAGHARDSLPEPGRARPHPRRHSRRLTMTEAHEGALDAPAPEKSKAIESPPEITPVKPHRELTARAIGVAVVLAAIDMLNQRGLLNLHLSGPQIFAWLAPSGLLGVLLAVPLRKHYIDQENLTFADGLAAGETLLVLDQGPKQAGPRVAALGVGGAISALFCVLRDGLKWIPEAINFT